MPEYSNFSSSSRKSPVDGETMTGSAERELAAIQERCLRLAADFDNFRKRTALESERRAAGQKEAFIHELLPVIDNLERALTSSSEAPGSQLRQGIQLIHQQLLQLLRPHHIEPEETDGLPFDPHRHKAAAARRDPTRPDQIILETLQRGCRRGPDVFRPATVVVNDLDQPEDSRYGG